VTPPFPPYEVMPWTQKLFSALNFGLLLVVVVAVAFNCRKHGIGSLRGCWSADSWESVSSQSWTSSG
jgi:hypothetical protein